MCSCHELKSIRTAATVRIEAHGRGEHQKPDPACPVCQAQQAELAKAQ